MLEEKYEAQKPGKRSRSSTSFQFYFISKILHFKLLVLPTQVAATIDIREIKCTTLSVVHTDSVSCGDSFSHILSVSPDTIHESNCKNCSEYESHLCKVLDELASARKIIDVLQKKLSIYCHYTACVKITQSGGRHPTHQQFLLNGH